MSPVQKRKRSVSLVIERADHVSADGHNLVRISEIKDQGESGVFKHVTALALTFCSLLFYKTF